MLTADSPLNFQTFLQISKSLEGPHSFEAKLGMVAAQLVHALQADWVTIVNIDPGTHKLDQVSHCGETWGHQHLPGVKKILSISRWVDPESDLSKNPHLRSNNLFQYLYKPAGTPLTNGFNGLVEPLLNNGQIIGILSAARQNHRSSFHPEEWQFLASISGEINLAFQNKLLAQLENKQRDQAATLREVARVLNSSLDLQTVLEKILDQLHQVIGYDSASVMLFSDQRFKIVASRKLRTMEQLTVQGEISNYPHIQEVYTQRDVVIIRDTHKDVRWRDVPRTTYIRCWLGVPLIGKNEVIGILNLDKEQVDYYTEESAALVTAFANQASMAIENARYYTSVQSQLKQLDALRETVADISGELQLSNLLEAILKRAANLLNATGGDLGLYDESSGAIDIVTSYKMGKDFRGVRLSSGEGAMGAAIASQKPVIVEDYSLWEHSSNKYPKGKYHSVIAVPFMIGSRVIGAIGIMDKDPHRIFNKEDEYLLSLFAQHAAIAVENARLYQSAQAAAERRAILHQVSQQIVGVGFDTEGVFTAIHQAASQLMPAEAFVITLLDKTDDTIHDAYLVDRNGRAVTSKMPADQGLSGIVLRKGEALLIEDLLQDPLRDQVVHFGSGDSVRSILAVPMRWHGSVIGMIAAQSYQPNAYSPEDTTLLEMLASYAGIALENTQLFQHIQQLATIDPVSGIFNRRHLYNLGHLEFVRANRFGRSLSVIMMDIDHFKLVNDRFGHAAGDQVLAKLAMLIRNQVREVDVVGRYGGEEFTVILPETRLPVAIEIAERLRQKINRTFESAEHNSPEITVSIGVAEINADLPNFASLVDLADKALYAAKSAGRDRVEPFNNELFSSQTQEPHKISIASPKE